MVMTMTTFSDALAADNILIAPGVPDTLSTLLAEQLGFQAVFLSGSAMAATHLGLPDIGLMTSEEIATVMRQIRERSSLPVVVDADSGFGNAYAVARTVRMFELAGASAVQIEDMVNDKHPTEVTKRPVIALQEMLSKLKAALDARHNDTTLISARTDVNVTAGIDETLERIIAFVECGVDAVFAEGLNTAAERKQIVKAVNGKVPVIYNTAWPATEAPSNQQLQEEGFAVSLAPKTVVTAMVSGVTKVLIELRNASGISTQRKAPASIDDALSSKDYLARYGQWKK